MGLIAMNQDSVRIEKFGRFWKQYVLIHSSGKLTRVPTKFDGQCFFWKEFTSILLNRPAGVRTETPKTAGELLLEGIADRGYLKQFWFGRNVLVYTFSGVAYMRVGRKLEQIASSDAVKQCWFGPFCFYSIRCGRISTFAFDTQWMDFISRFIDPTYDELDRGGVDFAGYVRRMIAPVESGTTTQINEEIDGVGFD